MNNERIKPECKLIGQDSNIFNLMGIASKTLRENGMDKEADELWERITKKQEAPNYYAALAIIMEYVDVV